MALGYVLNGMPKYLAQCLGFCQRGDCVSSGDEGHEEHRHTTSITLEGKTLAVILAAVVGGGGYGAVQSTLLAQDPQARPDAWTKTDAMAAHKEIDRTIELFRQDAAVIHMRQMDILDKYEKRFDDLEKCRERVEIQLGRISEHLKEHTH